MKKAIFIFSLLFLAASCTKAKAPEPVTSECQDTIRFSIQILPLITDNCFSCHNAGQTPVLSDHNTISTHADAMLKAMRGDGAPLMPSGGPALHDTLIQQFSCWIAQGKQNN